MNVYADNAATTKMCAQALKEMVPVLQNVYGNPSSIHREGEQAAALLEQKRNEIAQLLGCLPQEIYFTSGGTEADNWAIINAAWQASAKGKKHIISTRFEHHAVLHTLNKLEKQGFEITLLEVHEDGLVRPEELQKALREDTALVTIMHANNEIGTLQPLQQLGEICRKQGVLLHTDAVQTVGHIPIQLKNLPVDMLSLSGHKFHGPKGVGVLFCRKGVRLDAFIEGGAQERGRRGGTENLAAIVGMAAALQHAHKNMRKNNEKITEMRDTLIDALLTIPHSRLNGARDKRLPGIANFCFEGVEGEALLLMLDMAGISASSGSACTSGSLDPSHVLLALGLPHEVAHGSLRVSLSEYNTPQEMQYIIEKLPPIIARLRDMSPMWERIQKGQEHGI